MPRPKAIDVIWSKKYKLEKRIYILIFLLIFIVNLAEILLALLEIGEYRLDWHNIVLVVVPFIGALESKIIILLIELLETIEANLND